MRHNFPSNIKERLSARVNSVCSNPDCGSQTRGPTLTQDGFINLGVAAHITAASLGGPRFNRNLTMQERRSTDNGIWLCQDCAKLVDSDEDRFTEAVLRTWKREAEAEASRRLGMRASQPASVAVLDSINGRLEQDSNPRFGFTFLHPAVWDRDDQANGGGSTYRHPTDPRIELLAWGGHAVVSADLSSWVDWTLDTCRKESGFLLRTEVPAGGKLVDWNFHRKHGTVKFTEKFEDTGSSINRRRRCLLL